MNEIQPKGFLIPEDKDVAEAKLKWIGIEWDD